MQKSVRLTRSPFVSFVTIKVTYSVPIETYGSNTLQSSNQFILYRLTNTFLTSHRNKGKDQPKEQGLRNISLTISMHKNAPMPLLSAYYFQ